MISTRTHGTMDYLIGILLILAPFVLGFATGGPEMWVPIIIGAAIILYSLITGYELGVSNVISMPTHLWLDMIGGLVLALSPWIFGFSDIVFWPHLIVGVLEIGTALMTERVPHRQPHRAHA